VGRYLVAWHGGVYQFGQPIPPVEL
jgi:hypothetical protein